MKTGLVMVISAVALFTCTMLWGAFKEVPRNVYRYDRYDSKNARTPDSVSARSYFYNVEKSADISISAPVNVILDNRFNGVELQGDTSLFKLLLVSIDKESKKKEMSVRVSSIGEPEYKTALYLLSQAAITIRVGVGSGRMQGPANHRFSFWRCKKINTAMPISGKAFNFHLSETDTVSLQMDVENLTIDFPKLSEKAPGLVQLEGNSHRVAINNFSRGTLDATRLLAKDVYVSNSKDASIRVYASDLARIRQVYGTGGRKPFLQVDRRGKVTRLITNHLYSNTQILGNLDNTVFIYPGSSIYQSAPPQSVK